MDELVQRLSVGEHPVTIGGSQRSLEELKQRIEEMGHVFIKFTDTRGETDLGITLDKAATRLQAADFVNGSGSVHLEGGLTLNFTKVRCVADIDLTTLDGAGHLVVVEE